MKGALISNYVNCTIRGEFAIQLALLYSLFQKPFYLLCSDNYIDTFKSLPGKPIKNIRKTLNKIGIFWKKEEKMIVEKVCLYDHVTLT